MGCREELCKQIFVTLDNFCPGFFNFQLCNIKNLVKISPHN
jgi:hypothetical protein